jgi:RNA polymerase I-specific transcription initiation factor RRN7
LIRGKGFLPELEGVVRDLWALRLQIIKHQDKEALDETDTESQQLFSSQADISETDDESAREPKKKENSLPTLIDTLGLCYLGIVVLRIPVSLGDLYKYVLERLSC